MMDAGHVAAYLPVVSQILDGKFPDQARDPSAYAIIDANGSRFSSFGDEKFSDGVAIIELVGPMVKYGGYCQYGADDIASYLMEANANPKIVGVVLRTDSPGGQATSVNILNKALAAMQKPVVMLADNCMSAAYYVGAGCNHIMANDPISGMFGSIGVVMSFLDFRKHFEEKGIKEHTVYSDLSGFKNKAFMDALDGDYSALKSKILNPLAQEFQDYVKSNRTSLDLKVEGIISGETFTAKEALQNGLIDSIGDMNDAIKVVRALSAAYSLKS